MAKQQQREFSRFVYFFTLHSRGWMVQACLSGEAQYCCCWGEAVLVGRIPTITNDVYNDLPTSTTTCAVPQLQRSQSLKMS